MEILALTAVKGDAVAFTQPPGTPGVGEAHPVEVMSRSATVVRAWNVDVVFLPVFLSTTLKLPEAFVRAVKPADLPLTRSVTLAPETGLPACVTLPVNFTSRLGALTFFANVTAPSATDARVSTVPAAFGTAPAHGVVIAFQMLCPAERRPARGTRRACTRRAPLLRRPAGRRARAD